jgi:hypothetical protein
MTMRQRHIARLPGRTARQPAIGQIKSESELGDQMMPDTQCSHVPQKGRGDQHCTDTHGGGVALPLTPSAKQAKPASSLDHPDVDDAGGYALSVLSRKQSGPQQLAPGYLWNSTTQELIPILPEGHPDHRQNQEILIEATRRWEKGK